jgi:DNA-binding transcriptional ArsR family regulator
MNTFAHTQQPDIMHIMTLIGEPARATILLTLLSGEALPAGELAQECQLTPQTISSHLAKLVGGGLLLMIPQGRHRYYQLARPEIAEMLEAIQRIAPRRPVRSLRQSEESRVLCRARTCYDHLAGKLGVGMTQALCERELLRYEGRQFYLTERGAAWCEGIGLDWRQARKRRRAFAAPCLDWSERRDHLAGALGAAIASYCFERAWLRRVKSSRAVAVTTAGRDAFIHYFGVDLWPD